MEPECGHCARKLARTDDAYLTDPTLCGVSLLGTPLDPGLDEDIVNECNAAALNALNEAVPLLGAAE